MSGHSLKSGMNNSQTEFAAPAPDAYDQFGRPAYLHSDSYVRTEPELRQVHVPVVDRPVLTIAPVAHFPSETHEQSVRPSYELRNRTAKSNLTLEYRNLKYTVPQKTIIENISGRASPGKLLGIMGPSGAGKTTLLHCLSGRRMAGNLTGDVLINNNVVNTEMMQMISGFVEQLDVLFGSSTPREILLFAAKLRLDPNIPDEILESKVESVLSDLGLQKCRDSLIGYVGESAKNSGLKRGLSGGERKRLSIGFELITDPLLIFLDEPTTGLDSFAANSVIRSLKRLVMKQNRTVVFTIHQPSDDIFELIDYVHTLALGRTVYFGPRESLQNYFVEIGRPCPPLVLLPDHLIDITFGDDLTTDRMNLVGVNEMTRDPQKFLDQAIDLSNKYNSSSVYSEMKLLPPVTDHNLYLEERRGKASFTRQYQVLLNRVWKDAMREPRQIRSWFGQAIFLGIFIGLTYLDLGYSQKNVQDRLGCLFFSIIFMFMTSFNAPINLFPAERAIFIHEARQGLYDTLPYFLAKITTEAIQLIFKPIVYASCAYWLINLNNNVDRFFMFILVLGAVSFCVFSLALMLVSAIPNQAVVMALMPIIFIPCIVISGFYVNLDSMPAFISWLQHISFVKYGYRALLRNEFDGANFICTEEEERIYNCSCPYATGEDVINQFNMQSFPIFADVGIMFGIGVFCDIVAYFVLDRNVKKNI